MCVCVFVYRWARHNRATIMDRKRQEKNGLVLAGLKQYSITYNWSICMAQETVLMPTCPQGHLSSLQYVYTTIELLLRHTLHCHLRDKAREGECYCLF